MYSHIFFEHFRRLLQRNRLSGYFRQHQNSLKIQIDFVSGQEYSRDLLSRTSCHRFLFFPLSALSLYTVGGLRMWNLQHLAISGIPNQQILHTCSSISRSVTVQLLFFIYYILLRGREMFIHTECTHSTLCDTQGSQTDKCLDKISIIGTFICLLLIKCFVVERSTAESCDFHWWYCLHCRVEKKILNWLCAKYKISFDGQKRIPNRFQ